MMRSTIGVSGQTRVIEEFDLKEKEFSLWLFSNETISVVIAQDHKTDFMDAVRIPGDGAYTPVPGSRKAFSKPLASPETDCLKNGG